MTMEYLDIMCTHCDTEYNLEFDPDDAIGKPVICPFCGEEIEEESEPSDDDLDEQDDE